jgi:hypothetical protein
VRFALLRLVLILSIDKDLAGGETGWRRGGFQTANLPALDVFRKGGELLVTPNFPVKDGLKSRPFFMPCKNCPFPVQLPGSSLIVACELILDARRGSRIEFGIWISLNYDFFTDSDKYSAETNALCKLRPDSCERDYFPIELFSTC